MLMDTSLSRRGAKWFVSLVVLCGVWFFDRTAISEKLADDESKYLACCAQLEQLEQRMHAPPRNADVNVAPAKRTNLEIAVPVTDSAEVLGTFLQSEPATVGGATTAPWQWLRNTG